MPSRNTPTPHLEELVQALADQSDLLDRSPEWPAEQLRRCAEYGVYRWFIGPDYGGWGWSDPQVTRGYLALSKACLTTAFIITQRTAACTRIENSDNEPLKRELLPRLAATDEFTTVAISHLSTSRRHLAKPALRAIPDGSGYRLEGYSAWVTGACRARTIVTGATTDDGRQVLVVVPTDQSEVVADPPESLVGLTASCTGQVRFAGVRVSSDWVLSHGDSTGGQTPRSGTGGLQTSTLAVGLADAALERLEREATTRGNLSAPASELRREWTTLRDDLLAAAETPSACSLEALRSRANGLALRATQAALVAAKGTGYVVGHPAGRWCREALFFLVWSCPQPVTDAHLCELAGLRGSDDD